MHNLAHTRSGLAMRFLRFWFPLFLFAYLPYAKIVAFTLPVAGPVAVIGRAIPVPVAIIDHSRIIWYHEILRIETWKRDEGIVRNGSFNKDHEKEEAHIRAWAELYVLSKMFAKEMHISQDIKSINADSIHTLIVRATEKAQEEGAYQTFAQASADQMQDLIKMGIYFPDLAFQYSELPSATLKGRLILKESELPESYKIAIDAEDPVRVETPTHYVFVHITKDMREQEEVQYEVIELGVEKQSMRETFYAYLLAHPVKWF